MTDIPPPRGDLAPVDALRALPPPLTLATLARLERDLGPEAVAALRYELDVRGAAGGFWARPSQRLPDPAERWATCVITGDYGTGKTWMAVQLFLREILAGRSERPRIICATKNAIGGTIVDGPSGILKWLPPDVPRDWYPTKGHAGELTIAGVKVACLSADAPGQAIGEGSDLDLRDDVAKWVISCGQAGALEAWVAARKSCREGRGQAIVPTTPDGIEFIQQLLRGDRRVKLIDLGAVENNRGNLAANFVDAVVADLRDAGQWLRGAGLSPFANADFPRMRIDVCPPLVELAVAIDPAASSGPNACEVGIVGGGRDERDRVHVTHDASAVLDGGAEGWPARAWDLAEQLQAEHPGVPWHFVIETNLGRIPATDLLRAEERLRRTRRGLPAVNIVEIRAVRAGKNKCERARLPAMIAQQGQVRVAHGLTILEGQMRNLTPDGKNSDRADAAVHMINDLAGLSNEKAIAEERDEHEAAREADAQAVIAAEFNAAHVQRSRGTPKPDEGPMPVEGALPGDARYPGARVLGRLPNWRNRSVF